MEGAVGLEPGRAGLAGTFEGREGCEQVADVEGGWVMDGVEMVGAYVGGVLVAEKGSSPSHRLGSLLASG